VMKSEARMAFQTSKNLQITVLLSYPLTLTVDSCILHPAPGRLPILGAKRSRAAWPSPAET
jgi:hypothetical protein